jgi:predicted nucleic acid-binding protein
MLKRGRLTQLEASQAVEAYQQIALRYATVELKESLLIAAKLSIYAYDAYLIRCAQKYEAPLITLDVKLARLAQQEGINVVEYR